MIIAENSERCGHLDAKATQMIGFAGVILAFLIGNADKWSVQAGRVEALFISLSCGLAFGACIVGFLGARAQRWRWFNDTEWFCAQALGEGADSAEKLRRYHLAIMHSVAKNNDGINKRKAWAVLYAQGLLAGSVALLAVALASRLLPLWL